MNNWERVEIFDDSDELSDELRNIADSAGMPDEFKYYLREAAENIDGMWELLSDLKKEHYPFKPQLLNSNGFDARTAARELLAAHRSAKMGGKA